MPRPLSSGGKVSQGKANEALLISALLEDGQFTPERFNVSADDIEGYSRLWLFCTEYQDRTGHAPPAGIVAKTFSSFDHEPQAKGGTAYYADQVRKDAAMRRIRLGIGESLIHLNEQDAGGAYDALSAIPRPHMFTREPADVFDHALIEDDFEVSKIPVPYPSLMHATGGIGPAELWLYGARWAQGKSWLLCKQAVVATKDDYTCMYLSYEMQAAKIARRTHRMLTEDRALFKMIRSGDLAAYKQALDEIADRTAGRLKIMDTSYGDILSINYVAEVASSGKYDLVLIDHIGLMRDGSGHRAVDDWRYHATISNTLKEITGKTGTPILGAIQLNREGDKARANTPPKGNTIAGTDALGQDSDVMVMHKRLSERTMVHGLEKNREGAQAKWWSNFDPDRNRWDEITRDEAMRIAVEDGEINEGE